MIHTIISILRLFQLINLFNPMIDANLQCFSILRCIDAPIETIFPIYYDLFQCYDPHRNRHNIFKGAL